MKEEKEKLDHMTPEQKEDEMAKFKHKIELEKEHFNHGNLWIESKKGHDCDFDPNSKSPLAGCRTKHPPIDKFQPYQGGAPQPKTEDNREFKKSYLVNEEKKFEEEYEKK